MASLDDSNFARLRSGQKVRKDSPLIDFIGIMDELSTVLGICVSHLIITEDFDFSPEVDVLKEIQKDLAKVSLIASGVQIKFDSPREVLNLEETIVDYQRLIPKGTVNVIPGGAVCASLLYNARAVVRKAERRAIAMESNSIQPFVSYLNRLSDLLLTMAKYTNKRLGVEEIPI